MIQLPYERKNKIYRKLFWYLETNSFEKFLTRRKDISKQPHKNFPTTKNYQKKRNKINGELKIHQFDNKYFIDNYNRLKQPHFMDGHQIVQSFSANFPQLPMDWLKMVTLDHNNEVMAIFLIIDDQKSISLVNLASKRSSLSFGLVLCTELVKYCCENKYFSFDAGVSGIYGTYKDKIFLDSFEVYKKEENFRKKLFKKMGKIFTK